MTFLASSSELFTSEIAAASSASAEYLVTAPELAQTLDRVWIFGHHVLIKAAPSDFESLDKIGYFPFTEAATEIAYAIHLALAGTYKPAYSSLRGFLELGLVGIHFLALPASDTQGLRWVAGKDPTPFRDRVVKVLRDHQTFAAAAKQVDFFEAFDRVYAALSDRTHTRSAAHGHVALAKPNFPRFVPECLSAFAILAHEAAAVVATAFAVLRPVILVPLPMRAKFGLKGPMSGFLEKFDVEAVRALLPPAHAQWLVERAATDEEAQAAIAWVAGLPDLTPEQ